MKLVLAMEELTPGSIVDGEQAAELAAEVTEAGGELAEVEDGISETDTGIEQAIETTDELGDVEELLTDAVDSGEGLDTRGAQLAEIAIEAICAKVGISARGSKVFPAMEAFGSAQSRLHATKLALEGLKETAVRIWEAIKKGVAAVWNMIQNFFVGLVKNRKLMEKHLENLKGKVAAIPAGAKPKKEKLTAGAKVFSISKAASVETVLAILKNSADLVPAAAAAATASSSAVNEIAAGKEADVSKAVEGAFGRLKATVGGEASAVEGGHSYSNLASGRAVVLKTTGEGADAVTTLAVEVVSKEGAADIAAPSKEQLASIVAAAQATLKDLVAFEKVAGELKKVSTAAIKYADSIISNAASVAAKGAGDSKDQKDDISKKAKANAEKIRGLNKLSSALGAQIPSAVFAAVKGAADLVTSGISNLGAKTEEAKAE